VHVVGHHAIGVDEKFASASVLLEPTYNPAVNAKVFAESPTIVEAQGDEVRVPAAVIFPARADVLTREVSGRRHAGCIAVRKI
jgi:hypothetical protein